MLGGKIGYVDLDKNERAEFFIREAGGELALSVAYYEKGKIFKTMVLQKTELSDELTKEQFKAASKILDMAERIKKDEAYAEKTAKKNRPKVH